MLAVTAAILASAGAAYGQFGRAFRGQRVATPADFDGRFHYCRAFYQSVGFGGSWTTDYPNADINLSIRLSELTRTNVSKTPEGDPKPLIVRLDGEELFLCPLVILSAPGSVSLTPLEVARLREYFLKGGIVWTDDSWGSAQWERWENEIRKVLPAATHPIIDLPLTHPLFRMQFQITEIPQIPNIGFYLRSGGQTSEQGADSATPYVKAILDEAGRIMVLNTHNTDIADSWEREAEDPRFFYAFSPRGYAFAINTVVYAHTH